MAFNRFGFTKHWTNPIDFPTIETEESKVRADLQSLHDEAKDGINQLIGELEAGTAAASVGAKTKSGGNSTVQAELNKLTTDQHTHSNKSLLDTYDQTNANLKNAVSKAHSHSNSSILNSCTAAFTTTLKSAYDRLVTLFAGVTSVATTLGGDHTTIPTSKAVSDAIAQSGALPAGGSTGYALLKASSENYDMEWGPINPEAIAFLGLDILGGSDDTPQKWASKGVGYATYNKSILTNQPNGWGILENRVSGSGVYQEWSNLNNGEKSFRVGTTDAGWVVSWTKLATTDYALPRDGSVAMTGGLNIQTHNNGYGRFFKSHSDTVDYGTFIRDYDKNGNYASLAIRANSNAFSIVDTTGNTHKILHAGNYSDYALPRDGSAEMTGDLKVEKTTPVVRLRDSGKTGEASIYAANNRVYLQAQNVIGDDKNRRYLQVLDSNANPDISGALHIVDVKNGGTQSYPILHTGNAQSLGFAKIATGTYVGTGSGKGTENQKWIDVSVGFHPRFVWVWQVGANHSASSAYDIEAAVATRENPRMLQNVMIMEVTSTGFRALHWTDMGNNYDTYLNYAGKTYNYLAIA